MGHYVKSVYIDIFTSIEAAAEKCAERRDVCVCVCVTMMKMKMKIKIKMEMEMERERERENGDLMYSGDVILVNF